MTEEYSPEERAKVAREMMSDIDLLLDELAEADLEDNSYAERHFSDLIAALISFRKAAEELKDFYVNLGAIDE